MQTAEPRYRKAYLEKIRALRLLDDDFMKMVFDDNKEATALLLNVFFDRYDMQVLSVTAQSEIKSVVGRSVRFDIYAIDSDGCHYDIEIQRSDYGAGERRARYNSSMLDTKLLKSGQSTDALADTYVIFITEHDVRGKGRPIYRYDRMDTETYEAFDDGSHIIYVNGAYRNDTTRIGKLMHDFRCVNADDMHHPALAEKMRYYKETEGGIGTMCKAFEEVYTEAKQEGQLLERTALALRMLEKGNTIHEVADLLGITTDEVCQLIRTAPTEQP